MSESSALDASPAILGLKNKRALNLLESLGIKTIRDLLFHFPYRYEDFSQTPKIADLRPDMAATVTAVLESVRTRRAFGRRMNLTEATLNDGSGRLIALWFNQPYLQKSLLVGMTYRLAGKISATKFGRRLINPLYEPAAKTDGTLVSPFIPVYSLPKGMSQYAFRRLIRQAGALINTLKDDLPAELRHRYGLWGFATAVQAAHFPTDRAAKDAARRRLGFNELFRIELVMSRVRRERLAKQAPVIPFDEIATKSLVAGLPFKLTDDQRRAAWEAIQDMSHGQPMHRLLDGDVGSGKTVVAAIAMLNAVRAGYQAALMAPTEILARQHFESLKKLFADQGVPLALWTNAYRKCARDGQDIACAGKSEIARLADDIAQGGIPAVVGTHALIEEKLQFHRLALAVIDEQHRFGVRARQLLCAKGGINGAEPHLLSMTATPIPRSLALTVFGDLDLSLLREKPGGRRPIETRIVPPAGQAAAYQFVRQEIAAGRQAFIICPLIEESDNYEAVAAEDEYARLTAEDLKGIPIGLMHGRLAATEKEKVMADFLARRTMALVSTSVIEVGIDVPNATVMCILGAERFGLAQLHQFRGRVGRGAHQSYCLLLPSQTEQAEETRLRALVEINDGFALAEKDLAIRGPGEILGQAQSGFPAFKIASLWDARLIADAKQAAAEYGHLFTQPSPSAASTAPAAVHLE